MQQPDKSEQTAAQAQQKLKVLAVDDEEFNLEILLRHLKKAGYESVGVEDGMKAWDYLEKNPDDINIILLDKMMPKMDGIQLLQKIKKHPQLKEIPVILQTASVGVNEMTEGIQAGAYYYLTKPFAAEMLIAIVNAAARDYLQKSDILKRLHQNRRVLSLIESAKFQICDPEEGRLLAAFLANCFPQPGRAIIGLSALISNAIEHGNLEIGYMAKTELLTEGKFDDEVKKRLEDPRYKGRKINVSFERTALELKVTIKDHGKGFNWKQYMNFDPVRITDPNGRGIAMANVAIPGSIEYLGAGNEVVYKVRDANK